MRAAARRSGRGAIGKRAATLGSALKHHKPILKAVAASRRPTVLRTGTTASQILLSVVLKNGAAFAGQRDLTDIDVSRLNDISDSVSRLELKCVKLLFRSKIHMKYSESIYCSSQSFFKAKQT